LSWSELEDEMNETHDSASKSASMPNGTLIGIAVAMLAIGIFVYNTKPSAEVAQTAEPSTSGIASPKAGSPATAAQAAEGTTTGMGTSTAGYTGMATSTSGYDGRSSGGMAQKPGSFNEPKPYQPNNPYPDYRRTVTASDTGIGASTGTTGTLVTD
jgi:hypothetical protein